MDFVSKTTLMIVFLSEFYVILFPKIRFLFTILANFNTKKIKYLFEEKFGSTKILRKNLGLKKIKFALIFWLI
jgi:hypothetical protein